MNLLETLGFNRQVHPTWTSEDSGNVSRREKRGETPTLLAGVERRYSSQERFVLGIRCSEEGLFRDVGRACGSLGGRSKKLGLRCSLNGKKSLGSINPALVGKRLTFLDSGVGGSKYRELSAFFLEGPGNGR